MDVAAYFKELLNRERMVYVPGLGTFLTRKSAGVYNQQQQKFYPPKNSIDFVEEEKQDETLENYISRQKNISPVAARYFIEKFVEQVQSSAHTKNIPVKEVLFPAEAEAIENPNFAPAFNMENFGLPPVNLPLRKKTTEPAEKELVPELNPIEDINQEFSNTSEDEEIVSKRSTGFWASVLLLLAVSLLGCYALYLYDPNLFSGFSADKPAAAVVTKRTVADSITKKTGVKTVSEKDTLTKKAVVDTPAKDSAAIARTVPPVLKPATKDSAVSETADADLVAKSPYEIIGASFKTLNGAKSFLNQLKAKGMHRAKILSNTAGKQKLITFGSFKDKESAQAALEKLRARDPQSEAYIQHYIIK
ncbi:SPOR domain-containing protein [uncultured Mucilaginibacter sp.]|uniref:SPOR domain-containing protein n=1 Tax=uncultured Mucilaginibacter sp. TaxID=797541 RepID=UPI00261D5994|nr:SPOR domain-containing protein [uncultured Mucilaginibacter sp.]